MNKLFFWVWSFQSISLKDSFMILIWLLILNHWLQQLTAGEDYEWIDKINFGPHLKQPYDFNRLGKKFTSCMDHFYGPLAFKASVSFQ